MIQKTKQDRINKTLNVLYESTGKKCTIQGWMKLINDELTKQIAYRNTKELAQTFRYITKVMKAPLTKSRETLSCEEAKYCQTCYTMENMIKV